MQFHFLSFTIFLNFWLLTVFVLIFEINSVLSNYQIFNRKVVQKVSKKAKSTKVISKHRWCSFAEQIPIKTKQFERALHFLLFQFLRQSKHLLIFSFLTSFSLNFNFSRQSKSLCIFIVLTSFSHQTSKQKFCLFWAFWRVFPSIPIFPFNQRFDNGLYHAAWLKFLLTWAFKMVIKNVTTTIAAV